MFGITAASARDFANGKLSALTLWLFLSQDGHEVDCANIAGKARKKFSYIYFLCVLLAMASVL